MFDCVARDRGSNSEYNMDRRRFVTTAALLAAGSVAGCTVDEFEPIEDVAIRIDNNTEAAVEVGLTVDRGDDVVFQDTVTVEADGRRFVNPRLTKSGDYRLHVAVDGDRKTTFEFGLDSYDIRTGSNVNVDVFSDGVRVRKIRKDVS